ncbi:MAG: helix-turn-helix domain-containing protein [Actinoallomurus sp.]
MAPQLHTPAEAAERLGCTVWWLKDQARQGRIPFTMTSGAYKFSDEHIAWIARRSEHWPDEQQQPGQLPPAAPRRRRTPTEAAPSGVVQLVARPPRRARQRAS